MTHTAAGTRPSPPPPADAALRARMRETVNVIDAPDVALACSRNGWRTVVTGGARPAPPVPRAALRYEIGSATKTYTGLLLAALVHDGVLGYDDPLDAHLPPDAEAAEAARAARPRRRRRQNTGGITLLHAISHTAGLPRLPGDFYRQALPRWRTNPYAGYPRPAVLDAYRTARPRHRPGTRWHYSNLGVAVLGQALAHAAGASYEEVLTRRVLKPLGLSDTALRAAGPGTDATGHVRDARTPVPAADMGGFVAAGSVRATPADLLSYLEAHLTPDATPLAAALHDVHRPLLRRGHGHRHTHTLTWFHHALDGGAVCFHAGATPGQEAFLGFRPATGTAVVALATRRHTRRTTLVPAAYALLTAAR